MDQDGDWEPVPLFRVSHGEKDKHRKRGMQHQRGAAFPHGQQAGDGRDPAQRASCGCESFRVSAKQGQGGVLASGQLKGEALAKFVNRSVELL